MPGRNRAFTLIELLIIVSILGVLASLTISAYQTYTVRTQVAEGISLATSVQVPVVDAYRRSGSPPTDRLEAGLSANAADTRGNYVSQVDVDHGRVDITFGNNAHPEIASATLSLTPYVSGDVVTWRCAQAPEPGGVLMSDGTNTTHYQPGSIDRRYLPSGCR